VLYYEISIGLVPAISAREKHRIFAIFTSRLLIAAIPENNMDIRKLSYYIEK
jgi:hypothetical protein